MHELDVQKKGARAHHIPTVINLSLGLVAVVLTIRYAVVTWVMRAPWNATYPYANPVLTDFRDTVMLPALSIQRHIDPYNISAHTSLFPYAQEFDPYMPWWLTITGPLARLGWDHAAAAYSLALALLTSAAAFWAGISVHRNLASTTCVGNGFGGTVRRMTTFYLVTPGIVPDLAWGLAAVSWQWVWRPTSTGQGLGNVGSLAGLCALLSILGRRDGWWGLFVALAWVKPQFGIPVVIALLCRGFWRKAIGGTALAMLASLPMIVKLAQIEGGPKALVRTVIASTGELSARTGGEPFAGRIDVMALGEHFGLSMNAGIAMILGGAAVAACSALTRRLNPRWPALSAVLVSLTVLLGFPHLHYDLSMLAPLVLWLGAEVMLGGVEGFRKAPEKLVVVFTLLLIGVAPGSALFGDRWAQAQGVLAVLALVLAFAFSVRSSTRWIPRRPSLDVDTEPKHQRVEPRRGGGVQ